MESFVDQALGIAATASVAALIAFGLSISFRLMGVINLAHGEFLMIGAYTAVECTRRGTPFWVAVLMALVMGCGLGGLVEMTLIRRFYQRTEITILSTFGLSLVMRQAVELWYGPEYQALASPLPQSVSVLGADFPAYRLLLAGISIVVIGGLLVLLVATSLGVRVRAVSTDSPLAESLGVRAGRMKLCVFALSTGLACLAGALVAPTTNVSPNMGQTFLFIAFVVVIIGGTRLGAVLVAAVVVAAVQNLTTVSIDAVTAQLAVLGLAFGVLAFAQRRRTGVTI